MSLRISECLIDWFSPIFAMNASVPNQEAPCRFSSLINLSISFSYLLASSTLSVKENSFNSDYFPIVILVELHPLSLPNPSL